MRRSAGATPSHSLPGHLLAHRRLLLCALVGALAAIAWPGIESPLLRAIIGWNVLVWLYLTWVAIGVFRSTPGHIRRLAMAQAESAPIVLAIVVVAALVSMAAVVLEIRQHIVFAFATVVGSWLLLPTLFGLSYASMYFASDPGGGLIFPGGSAASFEPDHTDFLYFAFTLAVATQTADVAVSTREMRRLVIVQSVLSFVFNTAILAFSINAAVGYVA